MDLPYLYSLVSEYITGIDKPGNWKNLYGAETTGIPPHCHLEGKPRKISEINVIRKKKHVILIIDETIYLINLACAEVR